MQTRWDVILDCERLKYPYTGLHEYCLQLSLHLLRNNRTALKIGFFLPRSASGLLGAGASHCLAQHPVHKIYNAPARRCCLWHGTSQGSLYFPHRGKMKKLLTIHDLNFMIDKRSAFKRKRYLDRVQRQVDLADHLTMVSFFTKDFAASHLDLGGKPVSVIYNGCEVDLAAHPPQKPDWMVEGGSYIFSIGTLAVKKNFHVLPALLRGNNLRLIIAGWHQDPSYREKIIMEAERFKVADRILLPGPVSTGEKWWLMQHAAAFALPSLAEGFGIPVAEAMHFGIPIFLSNHTSLPEIGGDAAYYFDSFEPDSMSHTFETSLQHFHADSKKKERIRIRKNIFDWDHSASQYLAVYQNLLSSGAFL